MYNFFTNEEVEQRLSKHYCDSVIVDTDEDMQDVMVKVGNNPFKRMERNEVAQLLTGKEGACAFVECGGLMVFNDRVAFDNYWRTHDHE